MYANIIIMLVQELHKGYQVYIISTNVKREIV